MPDVPVSGWARRAWQVRTCLAAWLVAVLALAPVSQPPADAAAVPAGTGESLAPRHAGARDASVPTTGLRPAEPLGCQGVLARSLLVETAFGPPPATCRLYRPNAPGLWRPPLQP